MAQADAALRALTVVNKAAAWYLERSDPTHWGRCMVIERERGRKPKVIGFNRSEEPTMTNHLEFDALKPLVPLRAGRRYG